MILYSNNHKVDQVNNTATLTFSDRNDIYNQSYHLVLNAWDSEGNLYQASATIKVIDGIILAVTRRQASISALRPTTPINRIVVSNWWRGAVRT